MSRWLIVGGGIQGTHIAARLVEEAGLDPQDLMVVDPAPHLLHNWRRCTAATGMTYLRSPAVHHMGVEPFELLRHGQEMGTAPCGRPPFEAPYNRPAVSLFNAHADDVIARTGIAQRHLVGRAVHARLGCDQVRLELEDGTSLAADRLVLALGAGEQPVWPDWARAMVHAGADIRHIFEPGATPPGEPAADPSPAPAAVAVIGAGISGVQLAMRLATGAHPLVLVSGHPLRTHQFDSAPGWLGPRFMSGFADERDPDRRRAAILEARNAGSVPPALAEALGEAIDDGRIQLHAGPVASARIADGRVALDTATGSVTVDRVVLATGFQGRRPGGRLVDELVESHRLPCASCGYPVPDAELRWHPRVFVAGALAELQLGPSARNIAGARRSAQRLLAAEA